RKAHAQAVNPSLEPIERLPIEPHHCRPQMRRMGLQVVEQAGVIRRELGRRAEQHSMQQFPRYPPGIDVRDPLQHPGVQCDRAVPFGRLGLAQRELRLRLPKRRRLSDVGESQPGGIAHSPSKTASVRADENSRSDANSIIARHATRTRRNSGRTLLLRALYPRSHWVVFLGTKGLQERLSKGGRRIVATTPIARLARPCCFRDIALPPLSSTRLLMGCRPL